MDPGQIGAHIDIDTRNSCLGASNAPGHQTHHVPYTIAGADKRRSPIPGAGILASFSAGTNEAGGTEDEGGAQSGCLQRRLAIGIGNQGHIHLPLNGLVRSGGTEVILAPPSYPASLTHETGGGQTDSAHSGFAGQRNGCGQLQDGHIVLQIVGIEGRIDVHIRDVHILGGNRFARTGSIPFPQTNLKGSEPNTMKLKNWTGIWEKQKRTYPRL